MNKTLSFGHQSHLLDNNGHQGRLDFSLFKKVLEVLSPKVMTDYPPTLALAEVLKRFLLPLLERVNDKRCVHNKNIQKMLL